MRKAVLASSIQKGFKSVTMEDICEAAGLSRGGLYTHYGSAGQVFADTVEELMSGLESQIAGKVERGLPTSLILDELLERYQFETLDRSGSLGLASYEYYSGLPLTESNVMLKQYYSSKTMSCSPIEYDIGKGEFRQAYADAAVDLLLFSYQGVRMLSSIIPLDDDNIPEGMIREIRSMLAR